MLEGFFFAHFVPFSLDIEGGICYNIRLIGQELPYQINHKLVGAKPNV